MARLDALAGGSPPVVLVVAWGSAMAREGRALPWIVTIAALACRDGEPSLSVGDAQVTDTETGDPLLARARKSMRGGAIDPAIVAELVASDEPAHARARRLLRAMEREASGGEAEDAGESGRPSLEVPGAADDAAVEPVPSEGGTKSAGSDTGDDDNEGPVRRERAVLRSISLRERKGGMTMTLHASEGVLVGTAHQRQTGTLRLVVESVGAAPRLLRSRPAKGEVEVTDVRRGQDTVIITVRVPAGWRVGRTRRFGGGARIELVAP